MAKNEGEMPKGKTKGAYKEVIIYLIFGVLTTIVNIVVYSIAAYPLEIGTVSSSIIAWIAAVLFAYITNRSLVFHSKTTEFAGIIKEAGLFFGARLATGIIDWVFMYISVDILLCNDVIMKTVANVIVVALNYLASKLFIFKTGRTASNK